MTEAAVGCPDENAFAKLVEGRVDDAERARLEQHLDSCEDCAWVMAELGATTAPAQVPERYRLIGPLGAGGMGTVWEAEDTQEKRRVAIKLLRPDAVDNAAARARMVREARALATVSHENVLRILDAGGEDEVYLVLELVEGVTAQVWAEQTRTATESLALWRQVGEGLSAIHAAGIVHRDLKPQNVLVARDGRAVVADFGLAAGAIVSGDEVLTITGQVLGTPSYMALEQLRGEPGTAKSDQFSLCVCIWEAITGTRPFARPTAGATALAMMTPPAIPDGADATMFAALVRGLDADPAKRWPDVETLLAALGALDRTMLHSKELVGGKYELGRELGRGGMGRVVAAVHRSLGTRVAIKLLNAGTVDAKASARMLREARVVAKLRSDHVCRVTDVGELPTGSPYIVMELLDGEDLAHVVKRGPLPEALAMRYVREACEALAEAHAAGIIHRDVKPANLFACDVSSGTRIKVLDFGIAAVTDAEFAGGLTSTDSVLGSPIYMAPEQLRNASASTARTDIWALGATLYELLVGKPPFTGNTFVDVSIKIATEEHPRAVANPALAAIIDRCLQKEPADRYATVSELAAALDASSAPLVVQKRRRTGWIAAALLGVVLVGGVWAKSVMSRSDEIPQAAAQTVIDAAVDTAVVEVAPIDAEVAVAPPVETVAEPVRKIKHVPTRATTVPTPPTPPPPVVPTPDARGACKPTDPGCGL